MTKVQRSRLAELNGKTNLTDAEKAEQSQLAALAAQHPDPAKDTDGPAAPQGFAEYLATAFSSVRSRLAVSSDLVAARAQNATLTTERDTARTERDQARGERDTATAQLNAIAAFFGVKPDELAGKDAAGVTAIFAKKVEDATIEKVAGIGFPVDQLPKQSSTEGGADAKELSKAEFNALSPEAKSKFSVNGGRITD